MGTARKLFEVAIALTLGPFALLWLLLCVTGQSAVTILGNAECGPVVVLRRYGPYFLCAFLAAAFALSLMLGVLYLWGM